MRSLATPIRSALPRRQTIELKTGRTSLSTLSPACCPETAAGPNPRSLVQSERGGGISSGGVWGRSSGLGEGTISGPGSGSPEGRSGGGVSGGVGGRITSGPGTGMGSMGSGVAMFPRFFAEMRGNAHLFRLKPQSIRADASKSKKNALASPCSMLRPAIEILGKSFSHTARDRRLKAAVKGSSLAKIAEK